MRSSNVLLAALLVPACASPGQSSSSDISLKVDTVLPPGNALLAKPLDLAIGKDGEVYVSDIGSQSVLVVGPDGRQLRSIGREGAGPGEFRFPRSLAVSNDTLRLVDAGNGRALIFDTSGTFVRAITELPGISTSAVAFDQAGAGLLARQGLDSTLARRFSPVGTVGAGVGHNLVPSSNMMDFRQIKADLAAERVPQSLRNYNLPILGDDGSAWLLLLVDGIVQRYSPQDSLVWQSALADSLAGRLRQDIYAKNRADTVPFRFTFPNLFLAARPVGQDLWVLLREPDDHAATILILDSGGHWSKRLTLPGATNAGSFAVGPNGKTLYLVDRAEGALLRATAPQ